MKRKIFTTILIVICIFTFNNNVFSKTNTYKINISDSKIKDSSSDYENIKTYTSLDDFLIDYNSNSLPSVYLTTFLFDGVSAVKSPDLDDFIEANSNNIKIKTLDINVLNINGLGNYELTGKATGYMIAVNTNNMKGNINIILNNVSIDTDTKKAPAIYVYNKSTTYTDCIVTIKTKKGTNNYIEGGKLKKVSLMPSDNLESYNSYYSKNELNYYETFSSYYGIYEENEIKNILFATVKSDEEDLKNNDPYVFYKASGAISSDIDLFFEGEGYLKVSSKNKEGIETKGNLTFSGGTGDYEIYAFDDCLNTTTSSSAGTNIRNAITIDVNSLLAVVNDEADEGDAIDSNGSLTINGGTIYAFANSNSQDSGLDSENGIVINKGTIIATGNMADMISSNSKQKYIYLSLNQKVNSGSLIVIKDENNNIITAFKSEKSFSTLLYSDDNLNYESLKVYTGGTIDGEEKNGLYTKINNYKDGSEITFTEVRSFNNINNKKVEKNNFILTILLFELTILIVVGIVFFINKKIKKH